MSRVIDHFPSWMTGVGIFHGMTGTPWDEDETVDNDVLDMEYFGNRSGLKNSSPILEKMTAFRGNNVLSDTEIERLQSIIVQKFADKWQHIWDALASEYNPLENYSMTETDTRGEIITRTQETDIETQRSQATDVETSRSKNTDMQTETSTETDITTDSDASGSIYGFNSTDAVPATESEGTSHTTGAANKNKTSEHVTGDAEDNVETEHVTGSAEDNVITEHVTGSADDNVNTETHSGSNSLTRSGNIGVTTSQQMLQSEIEIRNNVFFEIVFADVDTILTRPSWEVCY